MEIYNFMRPALASCLLEVNQAQGFFEGYCDVAKVMIIHKIILPNLVTY
jgi:hypothetical protein